MGATIHYHLSLNTSDLNEGLKTLEEFRTKIKKLPVERVEDILSFNNGETSSFDKDTLEFFKIEALAWIKYKSFEATKFVAFNVLPTSQAESASFGFALYQDHLKDLDPKYKTLSWEAYCKTNRNTKHHLLVIAILDIAKEMGILREVLDETKFWDDRNLKNLDIKTDQILPKKRLVSFAKKCKL